MAWVSEAQLQESVIAFCRMLDHPAAKVIYAIPNEVEGKATREILLRRARRGVVSGMPDIHVPWPSRGYIGMYLELKVGTNTLSQKQFEVMTALKGFGHHCYVAHNFREATDEILAYLGLN